MYKTCERYYKAAQVSCETYSIPVIVNRPDVKVSPRLHPYFQLFTVGDKRDSDRRVVTRALMTEILMARKSPMELSGLALVLIAILHWTWGHKTDSMLHVGLATRCGITIADGASISEKIL